MRQDHLSNAWNGDRVLVKIIKEGTRRRSPEGAVKLILERANPSLLARVVSDNGNYRAIPLDDRLLFELALKENGQDLKEAVDHLVHVAVLRYSLAQTPPIGKVTRVLGSDAEAAADTDIVCCKHDLPQTFREVVLEAAKALSPAIDPAELARRRDCRSMLTLTIEDKAGSDNLPWIENAFTLEKIDAEYWQLGIHIADVAHYIAPDSPLDREAKKRGTTIYLGDKVLPLFPEAVSRCCSLLPGEDRLTLSAFLKLNETGQAIEFEMQPTVIKVDHPLSYEQVQSLLNQEAVEPEMAEVVERLQQLFFTLSPQVRAQRHLRGGFEICLAHPPSPYKDEGRLGAIVDVSFLPVRSLLTELVVLAGKAVADHLSALEVPGIYCTQVEPDWDDLEDLLQLVNNLGLQVDLESEEAILPQDYQRLTQAFSKSPSSKVLHYLLLSTLKLVKYTTKPGTHFGLACGGYTHCTSPGQRYLDLLVQRVLKAVFDQGRDRRNKLSKNPVNLGSSSCHGKINWNVLPSELQEELEAQLSSALSQLNDREKLAGDAEKDLEGLKKAEKMKERTGQIFQGLITGVQSYGFFVEIEDLLVEGLVHVSSLKDDWYEYRSRHNCLIGRKNRVAYRLGDRVEVEVKSVDYYRQQIDLVTVRGGSTLRNEDLEEE